MSTPRERTLKPWRRWLGLAILGAPPTARNVTLSRNWLTVMTEPADGNPNDAALFITYTRGETKL